MKWLFLLTLLSIGGPRMECYQQDDSLELNVNKLTSIHTQIPKDYYSAPFCQPEDGPKMAKENLGELLTGNKIQNSPYQIHMLRDVYCQQLCEIEIGKVEAAKLGSHIRHRYHHNWILDTLPSAGIGLSGTAGVMIKHNNGGFPIGFVDTNTKLPYVFNHANIVIDYLEQRDDPATKTYRVVGLGVEPMSISHEFRDGSDGFNRPSANDEPLSTCVPNQHMERSMIKENQIVEEAKTIIYTYDVIWRQSDVTNRWEAYLTEDHLVPDEVHWYSIINSIITVIIAIIVIACVWYRNISPYKRLVSLDEEQISEQLKAGWRVIRGDVFRPPGAPMFLSVMCGTGAHLLISSLVAALFALIGVRYDPGRRGSYVLMILVAYMLMGSINGFCTVRFYKTFGGNTKWHHVAAASAFAFPCQIFCVFIPLQFVHMSQDSTAVVPPKVHVMFVALWLATAGFVFIGGYFGNKRSPLRLPIRPNPNETPHQMPPSSWRRIVGIVLFCVFAAVTPFASMYVEDFFLMTTMWMGQPYNTFGFFFVVLLAATIMTATITVVFHFFLLLKSEDHRWWWKDFFAGGGFTAFFTFVFSCFWIRSLELSLWSGYVLYFCYMGLICMGLFLAFGFVGISACLWFNQKLYSVFEETSPESAIELPAVE